MAPLNHADVGNPSLAECPYRLLDEVETRHAESDAGASLHIFFLDDECRCDFGLAAAGWDLDHDPSFACIESGIDLGDGIDLMLPEGRTHVSFGRPYSPHWYIGNEQQTSCKM